MTERAPNPYAPPRSQVGDAQAVAAGPSAPPVMLLLRWLLSAALVVWGGLRLLHVATTWHVAIDRAIIDPAYSPWPWLAVELSVVATAVLLALRSHWVFVPLLLHVGLFTRQFYPRPGEAVSGVAYLVWAAELLVFGFCALLWLRRGLR